MSTDLTTNKTLISGKIILTKKSGPGEITGVTEIDLDTNSSTTPLAIFKELQFTDPGDYIISITSTSNLVENSELSISVLPADDIIPQPNSKGNDKKDDTIQGSRPIIAQIDKPTIKIPPITMNQDGTGVNNQSPYTDGLGYTPFLWYKSYQIPASDIKLMTLYHDGIIPKIKVTFEDAFDLFKDFGTPEDNTTMELFLNSTSSNLKSIHYVFKISEFQQGKNKPGQKFTIVGTIDVPDLYVINNNSYNSTSFDALRTISKELQIGFNSNIDNTDDKMPWRNHNNKPYTFIEDIISHSYISDDSFMIGYIDFYYCFNYIDVEKEMKRDISNDVGIDTSGVSGQTIMDESKRIMRMSLTNDKSVRSSCFYFESFVTVNDSTKKSLKEGYITTTKSYDRINKQFLVFDVDSTTSDGSENIILKGARGDSEFYDKNKKTTFTGKLDTDNVHKNYNYAKTQNAINLFNLNKIAIIVKMPNANFNLYKFQKIRVDVINDTQTISSTSIVNYRYSGEYIIADISFNWSRGRMLQELRLVRKELSKNPDEVKNNKTAEKKNENREINTNPIDTKSPPNDAYVIGQLLLVQDKNGKLYYITITRISDNGKEVSGKLEESQRTK